MGLAPSKKSQSLESLDRQLFSRDSRKYLLEVLSPYLDEKNLIDIVHDYMGTPFLSTWRVGGDYGLSIVLPLQRDGKYNFTVDWGDGKHDQITRFNQAEKSHRYKKAGSYIVELNGVVDGFAFNHMGANGRLISSPSCKQIIAIVQWGCLGLSSRGYQFQGCVNLNSSAQDAPNLTSAMSLKSMFRDCKAFNGDLSGWNTAACTDMSFMFYGASSFNGDVSGWNTAACTNMSGMFHNASSFNGDVSGWNTAACRYMNSMFYGASSFNGDVSVPAGCTNMDFLFHGTAVER